MNRHTGMPLRGYRVKDADQHEIDQANRRLRLCCSEYRFVPDLHGDRTVITTAEPPEFS